MIDIILSANKKQDLDNLLYLLELFKKEITMQTYKIYVVVKHPPHLIFFIDSLSDFPGCHFLTSHNTIQQGIQSSSLFRLTYEKQVYHKNQYALFINSGDRFPQTFHDFNEMFNKILHSKLSNFSNNVGELVQN